MDNTQSKIYQNSGQVIDNADPTPESEYYELTENDKKLIQFVISHTDSWRDYRDQNFLAEWQKYERIWRGVWDASDKKRTSERSKVISPATQQAVETRHAEIMEAIFGQGEFFDISDDLNDKTGAIDVETLKNQLNEDFKQDKLRKSIDQIALFAEVYGTGIGEIIIGEEKLFKPMEVSLGAGQVAHGVGEQTRTSVKLSPVNPKNFLFDPNSTEIDDCMGVAVERFVSLHKIAKGVAEGKYLNVDISETTPDSDLEEIQEDRNFEQGRITQLTYYGLVPKALLSNEEIVSVLDEYEQDSCDGDDIDDYADMVEAVVIIGNGSLLLKKQESPYMMKDRPVISYQADTVPNRLLGRGTVEKAINMQSAIDGSMRSHMDSLALTSAPMMAMDATRIPRGMKFEIAPGKSLLTNGDPNEVLRPFQFGQTDGAAMNTSKEFERMLLMATGTIDSNGAVSQVARDANMDMATATMIKKYKRTLVNFQEDFLIPFIYKAAWRYMQFAPQRYPSVDVTFVPTGSLGIIAREYEQKQLAFMIQTLGAQSPLTPILMKGILHNSSLPHREELIQQLEQAAQPDPQQAQAAAMAQQAQMAAAQKELEVKDSEIAVNQANVALTNARAEAEPVVAQAKLAAALSNNLPQDDAQAEFEQRAKITEMALKEKELDTNRDVAHMQFVANMHKTNMAAKPSTPDTGIQ